MAWCASAGLRRGPSSWAHPPWRRGASFDDPSMPTLPIDEARRLVRDMRGWLHTRWQEDWQEEAHLVRLLRALNYEVDGGQGES